MPTLPPPFTPQSHPRPLRHHALDHPRPPSSAPATLAGCPESSVFHPPRPQSHDLAAPSLSARQALCPQLSQPEVLRPHPHQLPQPSVPDPGTAGQTQTLVTFCFLTAALLHRPAEHGCRKAQPGLALNSLPTAPWPLMAPSPPAPSRSSGLRYVLLSSNPQHLLPQSLGWRGEERHWLCGFSHPPPT